MRDGQVLEGKDRGLEEEESELARKEQLEKRLQSRSHCGGEKTRDERQEMMCEIVLSV